MGLNLALVGLAWSLHYLADTLGRSLGGELVERFGLGRVTALCAALGLLCTALLPLATHPVLFIALAMLHGFSLSPLWPGVMTLATRAAADNQHARAVGFAQMGVTPFIGIGFLATTALAQPRLLSLFGIPAAWLMLVAVQVLLTVIALSLWSQRGAGTEHPQRQRLELRALLPLLPAALIQTLALTMLGPIINLYAKQLNLPTIGLMLVLGVGALAAYGALNWTGKLADRRGPHRVLIVGLLGAMLAFVGLAYVSQVWALVPVAILAGLGYACIVPGWGGLVARLLPEERRAVAWGALMTAENLGTAAGPAVGSFAWDFLGHRAPFLVGAALFFAVAVFYLLLMRRLRLQRVT
nr:MFS transporter [Deinobacterium chartae]